MFKNERKLLGFTQVQLAEQVGVSEGTIVRWENGTTPPSAKHVQNLLNLGFSRATLLDMLRAHAC